MQDVLRTMQLWFSKPRNSHQVPVPANPQPSLPNQCEVLEPSEQSITNGTVSILDNQVTVTDPDVQGSFATVMVPTDDRVRVTIDGESCVGQRIVHSEQEIKIHLEHYPASKKFLMRPSEDLMQVTGVVEVQNGMKYSLKNVNAARHGVLELEGSAVQPDNLEVDEMVAKLRFDGYDGTIDTEELTLLAQTPMTREGVILRGTPPVPGTPAHYKQMMLPAGSDTALRRMNIATVVMGTTVAVLEPEVPGTPGRDVFGQEIALPTPVALPSLGTGVEDVDGRVVAIRNGRLVFSKVRIDVVPQLTVSHDLSIKDGKIEFDGDVLILGSVLDGCLISATGKVEVHGSVLGSSVFSESGVYVANTIVGSKVVTGQSKFLYENTYLTVKQCLAQFGLFYTDYEELIQYAEDRTEKSVQLPILASRLLEMRYSNLERLLMLLAKDQDHLADTDARYQRMVSEVKLNWVGIRRTRLLKRDLAWLKQLMEEFVVHVESLMAADPAPVTAKSVDSSSIRATGEILITGPGVYASSFESGISIDVKGKVRGGFLVAENDIRIDELGTPSGTETSVKVLNDLGKIRIRIRHSNTLLQVGRSRNQNIAAEFNVVFKGALR